jgi:predicted HicB family RNase H-like nuclease
MTDTMQYKGHYGSVHYSDEDSCFFGKIEHIRGLYSYEGHDVKSIRKAFHETVDEYLDDCKNENKAPDKPFKGSFNIRPGPELHRKAAIYAQQKKMNLNNVIIKALETYLSKRSSPKLA